MRASVNEVAEFLEEAYNYFMSDEDSYGTYYMQLNDYLELDVGWSGGYDEEDSPFGNGYVVCAKVCVNDDLPDYEWATMPYYEDGEVWDTEMSIGGNFKSEAKWFVESAEGMIPEIESGTLKIPGYEVEDDYDDEYTESKSIRESRPSRATTYELLCPEQVENDIESIIGFAECMQSTYSMWVDGFLTSTEMCESFLRYTKDIKRICDCINRGCRKN